MKELLMGNEAIAVGALKAGVKAVTGYPGTPSSEVLETVAKRRSGDVYVEWSVNEKTAMEVASGAAYTGARVLVTMKQVGLNVASDPLMCVNYVGVKGGMVVLSADDPGPISSQTEQDTRAFGKYARIPVFDPRSPEEAFEMIGDAFELSEKIGTPVLFRPTTRVCHSCASIETDVPSKEPVDGVFKKDSRWVIFPRLSYNAKVNLFEREKALSDELSSYRFNTVTGTGRIGVAAGGISSAYAADAISRTGAHVKFLNIATPYPFPEKLALDFLNGLDKVIVFEELEPVIEDALITICGKNNILCEIHGKHTSDTICAGENSIKLITSQLLKFTGKPCAAEPETQKVPTLPVRPPVLCAGCPHRASFYAVKTAMRGQKAVFSGDIGCYTLGNAMPLDMTDTCLCMGAGLSIPQGLQRGGDKAIHFGFVGDSTFFHSGITNIINAVYNGADEVAVILDNSTTAMTGHQPHPGIGKTMMGDVTEKISIEKILTAIGVSSLRIVNPLDLLAAEEAVKAAASETGVRCIIFRSPCIAIVKSSKRASVTDCRNCKKCIKELGCPAISVSGSGVAIDSSLCTGCGLCAQVCPFGCIGIKEDK